MSTARLGLRKLERVDDKTQNIFLKIIARKIEVVSKSNFSKFNSEQKASRSNNDQEKRRRPS